MTFQTLILDNDKSEDVVVLNDPKVNFVIVREALAKGSSVFITSKESQKLRLD